MKLFRLIVVLVLVLLPWAAGLAFFLAGIGATNAIGITVTGLIVSYVTAVLLVATAEDS